MSKESISPATLFGGTWNAVKGGLLACAGSDGYAVSGSTGGSKTISVDQMPSHNHRSKSEQVVFNIAGGTVRVGSGTGASFYQDYLETRTTGGGRTISLHTSLFTFGGAQLKNCGGGLSVHLY